VLGDERLVEPGRDARRGELAELGPEDQAAPVRPAQQAPAAVHGAGEDEPVPGRLPHRHEPVAGQLVEGGRPAGPVGRSHPGRRRHQAIARRPVDPAAGHDDQAVGDVDLRARAGGHAGRRGHGQRAVAVGPAAAEEALPKAPGAADDGGGQHGPDPRLVGRLVVQAQDAADGHGRLPVVS
jgi:hypothetical protein